MLIAVLGLVLTGGGAWALAAEYGRPPTVAEIQRAQRAEVAARWYTRTAGEVFPALTTGAERLAVTGRGDCAVSLTPAAATALRQSCASVLLATYADPGQTLAANVALVVLDGHDSSALPAELREAGAGVLPFGVPGTAAARLAEEQVRETGVAAGGPYLVLATAAYTDARPEHALESGVAARFAHRLATELAEGMTAKADPCTLKELVTC
ncbi:hypothetical protein ACIBG7_14900 [Nonomuraea sp. NPDC050328]|uniref:hypothetical protein n=1 Tax=Nonomuraea sp. NPDC050328 TaxID=3364361 RepID=UPI003789A055